MKLALLGDIALFGKMSVNENPNVAAYVSEVADYLEGFDYVVGNLETPFSVEKKTNGAKSAYICSDVENVKTLKLLHINAVCLANNHMFDYGKEGYETTKRILTENGIKYFGAEGKEVYAEILGNKIAFSGFCCYTTNPLKCVPYGDYGVNEYSIPVAQNVLNRNAKKGYLNIVAVHAGLEHVNYPSIDHIRAARKLADVCSYVYYGHHPHVIQGVEKYGDSLIAHSLGNFCFDDVYTDKSAEPLITLTENNRTGLIMELEVQCGEVQRWKEQVIYIAKDGRMRFVDKYCSLDDYNNRIIHAEENIDEYNALRNSVLNKRISERKALRDIRWYIKRLRPRYVKLIWDGRKNAKLYANSVKKYL